MISVGFCIIIPVYWTQTVQQNHQVVLDVNVESDFFSLPPASMYMCVHDVVCVCGPGLSFCFCIITTSSWPSWLILLACWLKHKTHLSWLSYALFCPVSTTTTCFFCFFWCSAILGVFHFWCSTASGQVTPYQSSKSSLISVVNARRNVKSSSAKGYFFFLLYL